MMRIWIPVTVAVSCAWFINMVVFITVETIKKNKEDSDE